MHQEDITWLVKQVEVPFLAYQAENSSINGHQARVHNNQANEASAYLMFIAEYYDCLPEVSTSKFRISACQNCVGITL